MTDQIVVGGAAGKAASPLLLALGNRHGLIAGATGTGKTVTLRVLAEGFSAAGVPVFMADVKGDLAAIGEAGAANPKFEARAKDVGLGSYACRSRPVQHWDVFGEQGAALRATVSDMGPLLLARLLDLNETQAAVLALAFKVADDQGLLLLDLKDLRALLAHVADNAAEFKRSYGTVSSASVGAIQRGLLALEQQGADKFFGEPALALADLMRLDAAGRGTINVLAADRLMQSPKLYGTFLLWLLSELFEELPEIGDVARPKLVFFFDEAHLLFADAPKALVQKVEQVVRLIRSKGVGVYFVSQSPLDIPETVLGQLGNRVQHALRAFTPRDQKTVRAAAETFRASPGVDTAEAIVALGIGEALVSFLDDKGSPRPVERALIAPPETRLGPLDPAERARMVAASPLAKTYAQTIDRESAYERLTGRIAPPAAADTPAPKRGSVPSAGGPWGRTQSREHEPVETPPERARPRDVHTRERPAPRSRSETLVDSGLKSVVRSVGSAIGREIVRGVLGSILKRR
jgi:DNA helicase HerA-like ATPase